ncbi:sucrase/ferredoxin domain-containing protein [Emericellopsis atlantica]|uniref:Sucrase/ferredoxin domain-containing protein n=1 Tax=Emericellopsis atlantica TaxID=2614577 RepID=A0A9P7ZGH7_9HYPO|nr:sucrase/ferredoxin domain-containing protein [Emericellopsis atlantica]KAG9251486.1 sucrase/ferredoxin domain-containing protein [Emericellopsis atlantica]
MAGTFKSLSSWVLGKGASTNDAQAAALFPKVDPAVDGEECLHDCRSCTIRYPRKFDIDEEDDLYGQVKAWSTHMLVATGKTDWVRDVADEEGSVMQAVAKADVPSNGTLKLSASNMPTPHDTSDYSEPTTILLLPAFTYVDNVLPRNVPTLIDSIISHAPTTESPLDTPFTPQAVEGMIPRNCPHSAVILMCSHRTRDARCGQSAPLLKKELERHLRPLGLQRDMHDERPGGVGIYFINHVGGHKYSANVMIYRRRNAFGQDAAPEGASSNGHENGNGKAEGHDGGAAQGIWLARVRPEDCENLIRYTVLQGKVVKPEKQLRAGFDRARGVMSW